PQLEEGALLSGSELGDGGAVGPQSALTLLRRQRAQEPHLFPEIWRVPELPREVVPGLLPAKWPDKAVVSDFAVRRLTTYSNASDPSQAGCHKMPFIQTPAVDNSPAHTKAIAETAGTELVIRERRHLDQALE